MRGRRERREKSGEEIIESIESCSSGYNEGVASKAQIHRELLTTIAFRLSAASVLVRILLSDYL